MHATRPLTALLFGFSLTTLPGCWGAGPEPGVTFTLCAVAGGNGSQISPRGEARKIEGAGVEDVAELLDPAGTITVQVRKTQYAKATFEITFPDKATQLVQVRQGESKDILPKGKSQKVGVRIEVQKAH
jgi:hypothetical protein